jgi:hypothetical protein
MGVRRHEKKRAAASAALVHSTVSDHWSPARHQTVHDHDKRDHQEQVDYSTKVDYEGTEKPKDEQDDGDRPEHACPLREIVSGAARPLGRATGMPHTVFIGR